MAEMSGFQFTETIKRYIEANRSVFPLRDLKLKKPAVQWSLNQRERATIEQAQRWFSGPHAYPGVAMVMGRISGNLQGFDHDCKNDGGVAHQAWLDEVNRRAPGLIDRLVSETSRSGGMHYYFTCPDIAGGVTLAFTEPKPQTNEATGQVKMVAQALIETKENGRYMACYPTPGYKLIRGDLRNVPELTGDERQILHEAAKLQNKNVKEEAKGKRYTADEDQPGSDYSQKATIPDVLQMLIDHGWTEVKRDSDESIWLERPGKSEGSTSANLKIAGEPPAVLFYVYTSNAPPFTEMKAHNAFTVRTFLKHDGDFKSCAQALRMEGFGKGENAGEQEQQPSQLDCCAEFAQRHSQTWAYDGVLDVWREWNNICWTHRLNDSTAYLALGQFIQSYGRKPVNSDGTLQSALKMLQRFMLRSFEEAKGLINFTNGTLDLGCDGNWRIREHRREDNLTSALNYSYVPGPHPSIDNFFLGSVPDPGGRAVIMTHIGLAILRDTRHRRALVLIGPPNSGKTIMLRLILATCGQPPNNFAPAAIFLEGQEGDRKRASWGSDLMAAIDELPMAALRGEDLPKAMMAHSGVPMRQMYAADTRNNQWLAKITMTANNDPQIRDQSRAMMSRLIFIDFPLSRREKRRDEEFDSANHVDMKLWDRLVQEVPAFAVSCIRAGIEAQKSESYPITAAMEARASQIARDGDSIKSFVEECCFLDPEAFTHGDDLFSIYGTYCSSGDQQCSKKLGFRKGLLASFPTVRECKKRIAGRGENPLTGFSGIGVQAEVLSYFPDRGIYSFKTA